MKVSSRGEYGLRALHDLAQHYGEGPIKTCQIAQRQRIPANYLNHLLLTLRRAGLIRTSRGRSGGHQLARSPAHITLAEAYHALEGSLAPIECTRAERHCATECGYCEVWSEVQVATEKVLKKKTLADIRIRK